MLDTGLALSRRGLLGGSLLLGASTWLHGCTATQGGPSTGMTTGQRKLNQIGIQLYTVREIFRADPAGTIKMLAELGYTQLEYAHMDNLGTTPKELRKMCNDVGISIPAAHFGPPYFFNTPNIVVDVAGELGPKIVINSWIDEKLRTTDGYKAQADAFNAVGADMRKAGLRYGFHNHDFEFKTLPDSGKRGIDILMQNTDPTTVSYELDMYWVVQGGGDNITHLKQYPGRFVSFHIKDRTADAKMVSVGDGVIPWAEIFAHIDKPDDTFFFVEHDNPPKPEREAVKRSIDYLRALRY